MAAGGAVAAVLPARVAQRAAARGLRELDLGVGLKGGQYKILLAAAKNCDQAEINFMISELRPLFT